MVVGIMQTLERERGAYTTVNLDKLHCSSKEDRIAMKLGNERI